MKSEGSRGSGNVVTQKCASKLRVKTSEFEKRKMKTMAEERASEYANVPHVKRVNQIAREMVILIIWQIILRKEHVIARINTLALGNALRVLMHTRLCRSVPLTSHLLFTFAESELSVS